MRLSIDQLPEFVLKVNTDHDSWGHDESVVFHIDSKRVVDTWGKLMELGTGVSYGALKDGEPAGFLLGIYTDDLLTGEHKAYEYLWMVKKQCRSGGVALTLLKEFEDGAKQDGCKAVVIGCHAAFKPGVLKRWYQSMGYRLISESFQRDF